MEGLIYESGPITKPSCLFFPGTESVSVSELSQSHVPVESELEPASSLPSFVSSNNNTLVTSVGQTVYLYCGVHNLGDRQVNKKLI